MATMTATTKPVTARATAHRAPSIKGRTVVDSAHLESSEMPLELLPKQGQQSRALICDFCTRRGTTHAVHLRGCDLAACDECFKLVSRHDVLGLAERAVSGARLNEHHYPGCTRRLIDDYTYLLEGMKSAVSA